MAVVELILDVKAPSWVTGNTNVPKTGEPVYLTDGRYAYGDGVTQVQNLTFFGGGSSSYTFGSGLVNTGGTVTNNLITGISGGQTVIGGTGITDSLVYKSTTGAAVTTSASALIAHSFVGGNNGSITGLKIYNDGTVISGPGSATKNTGSLGSGLRISQGTSVVDIGQNVTAGTSGIWFGTGSNPTPTGVSIYYTATSLLVNAPSAGTLQLGVGATSQVDVTNASTYVKTVLYVGGNAAAASNTKVQIYDTLNDFSQLNYMNLSSGTSASSDLVATADTGTNTSNYVNVGINCSGFSDASFTIGTALDSYLYGNGGNLLVGTQSAKDVVFFTGGTLAVNEVGRFKGVNGRLFLTSKDTAGTDFANVARTNIFTSALTTGADADVLVNLDLVTSVVDTSTGIKYLNAPTPGTGYTNGTYTSVPLTGGTGSGALATVVVAATVVYSVTITTKGTGYTVADSLSALAANIGGTGSGFAVTVAAIGYASRAFGLRSLVYDAIIGNLTVGRGSGGQVSNTAVGGNALLANEVGINNTAIGSQALVANIRGNNNGAFGRNSLLANKYGTQNNAFGLGALAGIIDTDNNSAFGNNSLLVTTGANNSAFGGGSGVSLTTGSANTFLGKDAGNNGSQLVTASNSTAIGFQAYTTANNQIVIGNTNVTAVNFAQGKLNFTVPTTTATLTLVTGSSLITAGAFALTLTSTAATNATFPTGSGTLTYLGGANTWTGQQSVATPTVGDNTTKVASTAFVQTAKGSQAYVAKTALYTVVAADYTIDCTSGTFAVTLLTAVGNTGKIYTIKNSGAGVITVNTTSSQTIDGVTSKSLSVQYSTITVMSNGANWIVLSMI